MYIMTTSAPICYDPNADDLKAENLKLKQEKLEILMKIAELILQHS